MTPYDRSLLLRTLLVGLAAVLVATGIVVATDETHSTTAMRVARLCAMTPALAALAQASTLALARRRGENRALESLGQGPWGVALGAMLAAWLLGVIAAALLLFPASDVSSLFPPPPVSSGWVAQGDAMLSAEHGIRVSPDGSIGFATASREVGGLLAPGRLEAISVVLPLALVLPAWQVMPQSPLSKGVAAAGALVATLLLLHAVAAGRAPTATLPLVALPLLVQLGVQLARGRRRLKFFRAILGQSAQARDAGRTRAG